MGRASIVAETNFHELPRRRLQQLCKKHGIPANKTNVAMADALTDIYRNGNLPPPSPYTATPRPRRTRNTEAGMSECDESEYSDSQIGSQMATPSGSICIGSFGPRMNREQDGHVSPGARSVPRQILVVTEDEEDSATSSFGASNNRFADCGKQATLPTIEEKVECSEALGTFEDPQAQKPTVTIPFGPDDVLLNRGQDSHVSAGAGPLPHQILVVSKDEGDLAPSAFGAPDDQLTSCAQQAIVPTTEEQAVCFEALRTLEDPQAEKSLEEPQSERSTVTTPSVSVCMGSDGAQHDLDQAGYVSPDTPLPQQILVVSKDEEDLAPSEFGAPNDQLTSCAQQAIVPTTEEQTVCFEALRTLEDPQAEKSLEEPQSERSTVTTPSGSVCRGSDGAQHGLDQAGYVSPDTPLPQQILVASEDKEDAVMSPLGASNDQLADCGKQAVLPIIEAKAECPEAFGTSEQPQDEKSTVQPALPADKLDEMDLDVPTGGLRMVEEIANSQILLADSKRDGCPTPVQRKQLYKKTPFASEESQSIRALKRALKDQQAQRDVLINRKRSAVPNAAELSRGFGTPLVINGDAVSPMTKDISAGVPKNEVQICHSAASQAVPVYKDTEEAADTKLLSVAAVSRESARLVSRKHKPSKMVPMLYGRRKWLEKAMAGAAQKRLEDKEKLLSVAPTGHIMQDKENIEGLSGGRTAEMLKKHQEGYKTPLAGKAREKSRQAVKKLAQSRRKHVLDERRGMPIPEVQAEDVVLCESSSRFELESTST